MQHPHIPKNLCASIDVVGWGGGGRNFMFTTCFWSTDISSPETTCASTFTEVTPKRNPFSDQHYVCMEGVTLKLSHHSIFLISNPPFWQQSSFRRINPLFSWAAAHTGDISVGTQCTLAIMGSCLCVVDSGRGEDIPLAHQMVGQSEQQDLPKSENSSPE